MYPIVCAGCAKFSLLEFDNVDLIPVLYRIFRYLVLVVWHHSTHTSSSLVPGNAVSVAERGASISRKPNLCLSSSRHFLRWQTGHLPRLWGYCGSTHRNVWSSPGPFDQSWSVFKNANAITDWWENTGNKQHPWGSYHQSVQVHSLWQALLSSWPC